MWLAVVVLDPVPQLKLLLGGMDLGQEVGEIKKGKNISHTVL